MDIEDWRKRIDDVDTELVELLNRRTEYAIEIGKLKRQYNLSLLSPDREEEIVANALGRNQGPLDEGAIRRLFECLLSESRRVVQAKLHEDRSTQGLAGGAVGEADSNTDFSI